MAILGVQLARCCKFGCVQGTEAQTLSSVLVKGMRVSPGPKPENLSASPNCRDIHGVSTRLTPTRSRRALQLLQFTFNLWLWLFMMFLMLSQLLTVVRNTTSSSFEFLYGQDPSSSGLFAIPGQNDEPYSDGLVVCVRRGRSYKAMGLNIALQSGSTIIEDAIGSATNGYRVAHRTGLELSETAKSSWTRTCRLINETMSGIFQACGELGYANLTQDSLRIVDDLQSNTTINIANALPILIMPFWDNAVTARYAIPAWDGHACMFRLRGKYEDESAQQPNLVGVNKLIRETRTVEWLKRPGGEWRNGWYDDPQGMRWYSDVVAKDPVSNYGLLPRYFDPSTGIELECSYMSDCSVNVVLSSWSQELQNKAYVPKETAIAISNGQRFGLFLYRAAGTNVVTCVYDISAFISNVSVITLLCRWALAMVVLYRGYAKGISNWHSTGLGSIANSMSFTYLPIAMLPRLKMILAVFFSIGCSFEGEQMALGSSWFVMYPSIVDFVLIYASLLNMVAKLLRRRMNDWVFPFTIVALSCMHYKREALSRLSILKLGGRIPTLVGSDEFERLTPADLVFTDAGLRMDGGVAFLLYVKLVILSISILSLLVSKDMSPHSTQSRAHTLCGVEKALAIRFCNVGGIGRPGVAYEPSQGDANGAMTVNAYEVIRLGYLVLGNRYFMRVDDWLVLSSMEQFKHVYSLWNHRVMVFHVEKQARHFEVCASGQLMSIHDPVLNSVSWWDIDARPLL